MIKKRFWLWVAIAFAVIVVLIVPPTQSQGGWGSSYNLNPGGYSAWYDWLASQNISIQRYLQPTADLATKSPLTLIQVYPEPIDYLDLDIAWVGSGHTLVVLGIKEPATGANFSSLLATEFGEVKIDSRRRAQVEENRILLGDQYGAIAWENPTGEGKVIYITSPFLAANAYQDYLANYQLLAEIVTRENQPLWFDEYIHGYREQSLNKGERQQTLWSYFQATWLFPLLIQLLIACLLAVWAGLFPLGLPMSLTRPKSNNTLAYIEAMAKVLEKAKKTEYIAKATEDVNSNDAQ